MVFEKNYCVLEGKSIDLVLGIVLLLYILRIMVE